MDVDLGAAAQGLPTGVLGHRKVAVRLGLPHPLPVVVVLGHHLQATSVVTRFLKIQILDRELWQVVLCV